MKTVSGKHSQPFLYRLQYSKLFYVVSIWRMSQLTLNAYIGPKEPFMGNFTLVMRAHVLSVLRSVRLYGLVSFTDSPPVCC